MRQATLVEIAESCNISRKTAWDWATKAGKKISSIKRKLADAGPYKPALFNEDELICILGENYVKIQPTRADVEDFVTKETNNSLQKKQTPDIRLTLEIVHEVRKLAELFERTTPGASADYCLNWAKKRLSGKNNGDSYTPVMNLLETPTKGGSDGEG